MNRRGLIGVCLMSGLTLGLLGTQPVFAQSQSKPPTRPVGHAQNAPAQDGPAHQGHPPPPHAYEDCCGRKAGDTVQHATPQGKVQATCDDSPEGLVARPHRPPPPAPPPPGPPPAPRT